MTDVLIAVHDYVTEHSGFTAGQVVKVAGEVGDFVVREFALDPDTHELLWATVYGGEGYRPGQSINLARGGKNGGYGAFRSFTIDRLRTKAEARSLPKTRAASSGLLAELQAEITAHGETRRPAPEDPAERTSLRERMYNAGRKAGVKVSVTVEDHELVARVRDS
jgi:hypothetical protein